MMASKACLDNCFASPPSGAPCTTPVATGPKPVDDPHLAAMGFKVGQPIMVGCCKCLIRGLSSMLAQVYDSEEDSRAAATFTTVANATISWLAQCAREAALILDDRAMECRWGGVGATQYLLTLLSATFPLYSLQNKRPH